MQIKSSILTKLVELTLCYRQLCSQSMSSDGNGARCRVHCYVLQNHTHLCTWTLQCFNSLQVFNNVSLTFWPFKAVWLPVCLVDNPFALSLHESQVTNKRRCSEKSFTVEQKWVPVISVETRAQIKPKDSNCPQEESKRRWRVRNSEKSFSLGMVKVAALCSQVYSYSFCPVLLHCYYVIIHCVFCLTLFWEGKPLLCCSDIWCLNVLFFFFCKQCGTCPFLKLQSCKNHAIYPIYY